MSVVLDLEIGVGSHTYAISRMSVFDQMMIATNFRNILMGLALATQNRPKNPKKMTDQEFEKVIQTIIVSPGGASDEAHERVTNKCLAHVRRKVDGGAGWAPVLTEASLLQFSDIELPDIVMLMYHCFVHNKLIDFFSESQSTSNVKKT